jgi:hypothetical protein
MIQHNKSHVTTHFTNSLQIAHIHQSSHSDYYKPSSGSGSKVVLKITQHLVQLHASTTIISSKSILGKIT